MYMLWQMPCWFLQVLCMYFLAAIEDVMEDEWSEELAQAYKIQFDIIVFYMENALKLTN